MVGTGRVTRHRPTCDSTRILTESGHFGTTVDEVSECPYGLVCEPLVQTSGDADYAWKRQDLAPNTGVDAGCSVRHRWIVGVRAGQPFHRHHARHTHAREERRQL